MTVAVKTQDGTPVSMWQDVEEVQLVPGPLPALVFFSGTVQRQVIGVQVLSAGMYAAYEPTPLVTH